MDWRVLELLHVVDEGAYGVVLAVKHRLTGESFAVKAGKHASADPRVMYQTLREVKILRSLGTHPNIIKLADAFRSEEEHIYLVFEMAHCGLHKELERLPGRQLPSPALKLVAWQILNGLLHCHNQRILHRDVKPSNVLVCRPITIGANSETTILGSHRSEGGDRMVQHNRIGGAASLVAAAAPLIKLCDFGFARHVYCAEPSYGERYSSYVVTRYYRAPEVLVGCKYGASVDIWSYGCTLAELATGRPLFPGNSTLDQLGLITRCLGPLTPPQTEALSRHAQLGPLSARVIPPRSCTTLKALLPALDPQLMELISICLEVDPDRRPSAKRLLQMPYFDAVPDMLLGTDLEYLLRPPPSPSPMLTPSSLSAVPQVVATSVPSRRPQANACVPPRPLSMPSVHSDEQSQRGIPSCSPLRSGGCNRCGRPALHMVDSSRSSVTREHGHELVRNGHCCLSAHAMNSQHGTCTAVVVTVAVAIAGDGDGDGDGDGGGGGGVSSGGSQLAPGDTIRMPVVANDRRSSTGGEEVDGVEGGGCGNDKHFRPSHLTAKQTAPSAGSLHHTGDGSSSDAAYFAPIVQMCLSSDFTSAPEPAAEPPLAAAAVPTPLPLPLDVSPSAAIDECSQTAALAFDSTTLSAEEGAAETDPCTNKELTCQPEVESSADARCLSPVISTVEMSQPLEEADGGPAVAVAVVAAKTVATAERQLVGSLPLEAALKNEPPSGEMLALPRDAAPVESEAGMKPGRGRIMIPMPLPPLPPQQPVLASSVPHLLGAPLPSTSSRMYFRPRSQGSQGSQGRSQIFSGRGQLHRRTPATSRTCNFIRLHNMGGLRPSTSMAAAPTTGCSGASAGDGRGISSGGGGSGGGGGGGAIRNPFSQHSASLAEVRIPPSSAGVGSAVATAAATAAAASTAAIYTTSLTVCTTRWSAAEWLSSDDGGVGGGFGGFTSGTRAYIWSGVSRIAAQDSGALISETSLRHSIDPNPGKDDSSQQEREVPEVQSRSCRKSSATGGNGSGDGCGGTSATTTTVASALSSRILLAAAVATQSLRQGSGKDGVYLATAPLTPFIRASSSSEAQATQRIRRSRFSMPGLLLTASRAARGIMCIKGTPRGSFSTGNGLTDALTGTSTAAEAFDSSDDSGDSGGGSGSDRGRFGSSWWTRFLRSAGLGCAFGLTRGSAMSPVNFLSPANAAM